MSESTRDRRRTAGTADQAVGSELRKSRSRLAATVVRYACGRADVVDRGDVAMQGVERRADRVRVGRRGGQRGLRLRRAHHRRRDAAERQPDLGDPPLLHARRGRETDFRDRLRAPGADLAIVLDPRRSAAADAPRRSARRARGPSACSRNGTDRTAPTRRPRVDASSSRRVVDEQRRRRVGGRRGIGDVAGDRAAVLVGDAAGVGGGAAEQRKFGAEQLGASARRENVVSAPIVTASSRDRDVPAARADPTR